jgi:hypothetical protein
MALAFNINQETALDMVLTPMVQNSNLYAPITINLAEPQSGTAPIGVFFNVENGGYLNTITMPKGALQVTPTQTQQRQGTYTPAHFATSSSATWALQDYGIYSTVTGTDIKNAKIQFPSTGEIDNEGMRYANTIAELFKPVIATDITRHAFWSETGVNFATAYTSNTFGAETLATLPLKNGFVKQIKTAIAANDIANYNTSSLNDDALTNAQVVTLMEAVLAGADYKLTQSLYSNLPTERKPVFLVSTSVWTAYKRYLGTLGDNTAFFFRGIDANGNPLQQVRALVYEEALVISAGDIFDDWSKNASAAVNQHYAILTARENLAIAYNFQAGVPALSFENLGLKGQFSYGFGMFPRMDFKIAIAESSTMSVAGFQ